MLCMYTLRLKRGGVLAPFPLTMDKGNANLQIKKCLFNYSRKTLASQHHTQTYK